MSSFMVQATFPILDEKASPATIEDSSFVLRFLTVYP